MEGFNYRWCQLPHKPAAGIRQQETMKLLHKSLCFCSEQRFPGKQARQGTPNSETSLQTYRCQTSTDLCTTNITSNPQGHTTKHLQQLEATGVFSAQPACVKDVHPAKIPAFSSADLCFSALILKTCRWFSPTAKTNFKEQKKAFCYNNPE